MLFYIWSSSAEHVHTTVGPTKYHTSGASIFYDYSSKAVYSFGLEFSMVIKWDILLSSMILSGIHCTELVVGTCSQSLSSITEHNTQ